MNITFPGLVNLYRHLRVEQRDVPTANLLRDCLTEISTLNKKSEAEFSSQFVKVISKVNELSKAVKVKELEYSPIESTDPEIRGFESQGAIIWQLMKEFNKDNRVQIVQKTAQVAAANFPEAEKVEQILLLEAAKQDSMIRVQQGFEIRLQQESQKLCRGLIGFYEIIMKRPALQYTKIGPILLTFPAYLHKIVHSFAHPKETPEALAKLEYLVQQTRTHTAKLLTLCHDSRTTESMIIQIGELKTKEAQRAFYESLKEALLSKCPNSKDPLSFVDEEATKISSTIPIALKGDMSRIAQGLADGFKKHDDHGAGAKLSGDESIGRTFGHVFGGGLNGDATSTPISISNPYSRDSVKSEKTKKMLETIAREAFENYYQHKKLRTVFYFIMPGNESLIERRDGTPLSMALGTVLGIIEYHLVQENTNLFGIDRTREPEVRKKVVLFGITNNIFPQEILTQLLIHLNLVFDTDVIRAVETTRARLEEEEDNRALDELTQTKTSPKNEERKGD